MGFFYNCWISISTFFASALVDSTVKLSLSEDIPNYSLRYLLSVLLSVSPMLIRMLSIRVLVAGNPLFRRSSIIRSFKFIPGRRGTFTGFEEKGLIYKILLIKCIYCLSTSSLKDLHSFKFIKYYLP